MKSLSYLFISVMFIFWTTTTNAQKPNARTLLWRITGKGLSQPSYLFGTMHLYDIRLFQFGDSVYSSLEKTDAYAMELDPNSMMDSLLINLNEKDTTISLAKMIDKKQYDSVAKRLEKKLGVPASRITRKMLMTQRDKEVYKRRNKDDMTTAVDLYLYNIAHKQGKWVGGIEDVNDQSGVIDELGKDFNVNEFLEEDEKKMTAYMNRAIELYISEDINKIEEWSDSEQSAGTKDLLLTRRNIKMARRMDSLSAIRTTFFAVGAAHLPGDSGVIALLRSRGFHVDPVFSSKKVVPGNYKFISKEIAWQKITGPDSLYTVEMPGKPTDINKFGNELKMKMYGDMGANMFFLSGFIEIYSTNNKDDAIQKITENFFTEKVDKNSKKIITNNGIQGIEMSAKREDVFCRLQVFLDGNKEYLLVVTAVNKESLASKDADHFLQSFVMNTTIEIKSAGWITYLDSSKAFSVNFPKTPEVYELPAERVQKNWTSTLYSTFDIKTNTYYILGVNETKKGYVMYADSTYFNQHYESLVNDTANRDVKKSRAEFNGLPAMKIVSKTKKSGQDIVTDFLMINKGNRNYTLVTVTDLKRHDAPNISQFNNSFKILPYRIPDWQQRSGNDGKFSTWSPASIELDKADTTGLGTEDLKEAIATAKKRVQFLTHDKYAATSYNVNIYPVSPYYWTNSDSAFYSKETARYYTDTSDYHSFKDPGNIDSLIYIRDVVNGNNKGKELLAKNAGSHFYKKIRVIRNGDSVYHLFAFLLKKDLEDDNNKRFFTDFIFNADPLPGHIFENKTARILKDIESDDSTTHANAMTGFEAARFTSQDLPLLLPALIKSYSIDSGNINATNRQISGVIEELMNDSAVEFIHQQYLELPKENGSLKQILVELLAKYKTQSSYNTIRDLIIISPPQQENNYELSLYLKDSLKLSATLFPAIEKLYVDSIMAPLIIDLNIALIDSQQTDDKVAMNNAANIYKVAGQQIANYKKDVENYYGPFNESVIRMLSVLNTKESEELQNRFLILKNIGVKQTAAIALLENNKKVSPAEINKIATDKYNRVSLYTQLKKIGKEKLFPPQFHTQQSFAEAYLYYYMKEEDDIEEPISVQLINEKIDKQNGWQKRYFLFKAILNSEGKKETHLAICGPFDMDINKIEIGEEETEQVFYDDKFNPTQINALFRSFLANKSDQ